MRIALGVEYDGSSFSGWQSQPSGAAVQDCLERALREFLDAHERVAVTCAGRTDAGVHALEQVVHLDTAAERDEVSWVRGTNRFLPPAVRVRWMRAVPGHFHARFSARSRRYAYLLLCDRSAPALLARRAGWHHQPLDVGAMREAAEALVGEHDFTSFRSAECQASSPVRRLHGVEICQRTPFVVLRFHADAFLHHMVRNMVGALVYVGCGRLPVAAMKGLLEARDRSCAPPTFMPDGLYLERIEYDANFGIPHAPPRVPFLTWMN
jgi:tRNA pseudouridine38-40 synthase